MKIEIQSPLPGTFYRKPAPDQKPYKNPGDKVGAGDTLGLIEVMKQYTPLTSDDAGILVEFKVADAETVETGQVVAILEKA